jgi:DNA-binding response OmpR family regulator
MSPPRESAAPVVLLVQPDDDSRDMYVEFLSHHGFEVVCPESAGAALTRAADADIIVSGLLLPGVMDGYEFIARLRAGQSTRHKPIVVVTAWAWQTERLRALEAGCDVFLAKPCLPRQLLMHIRRLLARARLRPGRAKQARRHRADGPSTARKRPA